MSALVQILLIPFAVAYSGFAYAKLWGWFAVPILGLPALGVAQAIAVAALIQYPVWSYEWRLADTRDDKEKLSKFVAWTIIKPSWGLLFGWILKHFTGAA